MALKTSSASKLAVFWGCLRIPTATHLMVCVQVHKDTRKSGTHTTHVGGILFEDFVQTSNAIGSVCGTDAGCNVRTSSNPGATRCTSNPDCAWVTADMAACLYLGTAWTTAFCSNLTDTVWDQLVACTSCGSPSTVAWGTPSLPFCSSGEAAVNIDLRPEDECGGQQHLVVTITTSMVHTVI